MRAAAASHGANAFVSYAAVETRSGAKVPVDVQGVSAQEMQEMQEMQEVQHVQRRLQRISTHRNALKHIAALHHMQQMQETQEMQLGGDRPSMLRNAGKCCERNAVKYCEML